MNILMLHDIRKYDKFFFSERYKLPSFLTTQQFNNIINNLINNKTNILSLNDSLTISDKNILSNLTVLTFDDGLQDHLSIARDLASKNIKACFFVPSGPVLENSIIDSHKIQFILASTSSEKIINYIKKNYEDNFNESANNLNKYFISRWQNNVWSKEMVFITRFFREFEKKIWKRELIDKLFFDYVTNDSIAFSSEFYLNINDVKEIASLGHNIGGHGRNR